MPRTERDGGKNRRWHREHERARGHHHEQRHRAVKCARVPVSGNERRQTEHEPPHEKYRGAQGEHDRRVARAEAIREALHRRLQFLRVLDEADDSLQRAVLRGAEHAAFDYAPEIHRASETGVADGLRDWLRLAGEHRLIARALTFLDEDVHGHLLIGSHAHGLVRPEFGDGHLALFAILDQARELGRILQKSADLALRPAVGKPLHRAGRGKEKQQHCSLGLLADEDRAEGDQPHQEIRPEFPLPDPPPHFRREIPPARQVRARDPKMRCARMLRAHQ